MANLQKGSIFRSRYEIKELLEKGGMGSVYLANDVFLDENVVIKVAQIPQNDDELKLLSRMQREYKILHNLDHPNIVKARDLFVEDEQSFLVMEYIKADSLQKMIGLHKDFLSIDEKLTIMMDLIATVDYVNKNDIIHRDIKPANILIDNLKPILVDFGISKPYRTDFEIVTTGAAVIGTYDYMSPEQLSSQPLTFSDVFSLGAVIYQLFTWQKTGPFHGKTPFQISRNIISGDVTPLVDIVPYEEQDENKIRKISHVIGKMIEKKPESRMKLSNALEVLQSLSASNK
ncbi:serine/threonine-protein kinase [Candidatus Uabimicrobium amorphum]|uniref:Serine/threonine protein kinase n=1 Tax=Uabimicrobium amorphum TaxID=2596890 RepID=A0A5S9IRA7_UABAM|nr:serine/threonine-protein kinase [Candidatus Uabimicrobium amorphum]BBM85245.1 serine/threonine protein kinase [Candidatus Uabimicrobium amorphum]